MAKGAIHVRLGSFDKKHIEFRDADGTGSDREGKL